MLSPHNTETQLELVDAAITLKTIAKWYPQTLHLTGPAAQKAWDHLKDLGFKDPSNIPEDEL